TRKNQIATFCCLLAGVLLCANGEALVEMEDGDGSDIRIYGLAYLYSASRLLETMDHFLRYEIHQQGNQKKDNTHHKQSPIVDAPIHHLGQFLGDNSRHGVNGFKNNRGPHAKI